MAHDKKKDILWRIYMIYLFVFLLAGFIIARVMKIQISEGNHWTTLAEKLTLRYTNIEAVRGNIFDINEQLLATSLPYYDVAVDMNSDPITDEIFYENIDSLALSLSKLFADRSKVGYKRMLINTRITGDRYMVLHKDVSYKELQKIKTFPLFRKGRYKGGLLYTQVGKRELPFKGLASRTIGYFTENAKPVGLEGSYNDALSGISGQRLVRKIAGGVEMPVNSENEIDPQDGCDIVSTIDIAIQDVAENTLLTQLKKHQADHGCVVLMEVNTGEIRAIANLLRVDSTTYTEQYNYAIGESTEPGSTFKLASLIAAMEDGYIDTNDIVDAGNGMYKYFTQEMKDAHSGGFGKITVKQAFEKSSNIGVSKLIYKYYAKDPQKFIDRLYKMGVNIAPQLDIAGAGKPNIKTTKDKTWSGVSLPWMAIGYELSLTPLQILTFYNAIANDGQMVKPHFVREIRKQGKIIKTNEIEIIHPFVASKSTIEKAKKMMEGVVENGTATNLKNPNYKIAGKTGTTQIANKKYGYKYNSQVSYQASFVGYFPADNPKYSCIVVVNAPSEGIYYGNQVAGPIFKEISDKVYSNSLEIHDQINKRALFVQTKTPEIKNGMRKDIETVCREFKIPLTNTALHAEWVNVVTRKDFSTVLIENKIEQLLKNNIMPNVVGMGLKDAICLLENAGLNVKVISRRTIIKQSIEAGMKFSKGTCLTIE
ncbi:MAG: penicillin-binding protein [Bacteroidota bacterium]